MSKCELGMIAARAQGHTISVLFVNAAAHAMSMASKLNANEYYYLFEVASLTSQLSQGPRLGNESSNICCGHI